MPELRDEVPPEIAVDGGTDTRLYEPTANPDEGFG
jgi:hypothetical protein